MQDKEKLRTGSMMTMVDAEREVKVENRQEEAPDVLWCMVVPNRDTRPPKGFHLNLGKKKIEMITFYKVTRYEHSVLYTECHSKRCQLFTLPEGKGPRDIGVDKG